MWGLNGRQFLRGRDRERGAAAMLVAITMVALVAFTAIAVDVGRLYWERAELQNGADLAALSIAQACAKSPSELDCTAANAAATDVASGNALDSKSLAEASVDTSAGRVEVNTSASEDGASPNSVSLFFARIFGDDEAEVRARAVARWGSPNELAGKFPLAFSMCEIDATASADGALQFLKSHGINDPTHLTDPCWSQNAGAEIPGGFGWLVEDPADTCSTATAITQFEPRLPGSPSSYDACLPLLQQWKASITGGSPPVVLLPVFDEAIIPKDKEQEPGYYISAYAAIEVHGWIFKANDETLEFLPDDAAAVVDDPNARGIVGRFIRYIFTDEDATLPDDESEPSPYGANIVKLTD